MGKFYAVREGRRPGVYSTWDDAKRNVIGVKGAVYKSFSTKHEAAAFMEGQVATSSEASTAAATASPLASSATTAAGPVPIKSFGSAGRRSKSQAAAAREQTNGILTAIYQHKQHLVWTDGSCLGNPGRAGSAIVVQMPSALMSLSSSPPGDCMATIHRESKTLASDQSTNSIAELTAIEMALLYVNRNRARMSSTVNIMSDSRYAIGMASKGWTAQLNGDLVNRIRALLAAIPNEVAFHWVPGHCEIPGNCEADALALEAAKLALQQR